eukprot:m.181109 g.181109  ORF g.181109 m.181109 type:complete len:264 (+) comp39264_c1_seq11:302-1093(+)
MKSWRSFLRDAPLKEGYVNKLPPLHKATSKVYTCARAIEICSMKNSPVIYILSFTQGDFQRRYLMLLSSPLRLEYYKDESCKELKGTILLKKGDPLSHSYTSELIRETESAFALNHSDSKRTYVFLTQTEADMFSWFAKIRDGKSTRDRLTVHEKLSTPVFPLLKNFLGLLLSIVRPDRSALRFPHYPPFPKKSLFPDDTAAPRSTPDTAAIANHLTGVRFSSSNQPITVAQLSFRRVAEWSLSEVLPSLFRQVPFILLVTSA